MLHIVAVHLRRMGLRYGVIDGTVNPKRRMDLVEEFNTNPKGPQVTPIPKLKNQIKPLERPHNMKSRQQLILNVKRLLMIKSNPAVVHYM